MQDFYSYSMEEDDEDIISYFSLHATVLCMLFTLIRTNT